MAIDVTVTRIVPGGRWPVIGDAVIYPKMSKVSVDNGCLHIWRTIERYPNLPASPDGQQIHEVSMPLSTVWEWRVEDVHG